MKIAFQTGGNVRGAEAALMRNLLVSASRLELDVRSFLSCEDVSYFDPDLVISLDATVPKVTRHVTLGCVMHPPSAFDDDRLIRNIVSHDGHLVAGSGIGDYLDDLGVGMVRNFESTMFYSSCPETTFTVRKGSRTAIACAVSLAEVTTRLPFMRFLKTDDEVLIDNNAASFGQDISSRIIRDCGIGLHLHDPAYLDYRIPSRRLFETVSSSSVLITDKADYLKDLFGDRVFYVNRDAAASNVSEQLMAIYDTIRSRPEDATEMAREAHRHFSENFSLDRLLTNACDLGGGIERRRTNARANQRSHPGAEIRVDCIVRTGLRDAAMLRRALSSLAAQSIGKMGVILINNGNRPYVRDVMLEFEGSLRFQEIVIDDPRGRSHSLWEGLRAVESPYFCILDDDDSLFPEHVESLVDILDGHDRAVAAYGGAVRVLEGKASDIGYDGGEARELVYFYPFDRSVLFQGINFIPSNAFLGRSNALDEKILTDPKLNALEDLWLIILLSGKGEIIPSWRVSSEFYWRRDASDNISFDNHAFDHSLHRVRSRLHFMPDRVALQSNGLFTGQSIGKLPSRPVVLLQDAPNFSQGNGHIDKIRYLPKQIEIEGWGGWRNINDEQKLMISGVRGRIVLAEVVPRPDVVHHMNDWSYYFSGFRIRLALDRELGDEREHIGVFAADEKGSVWRLAGLKRQGEPKKSSATHALKLLFRPLLRRKRGEV